MDRIKISLPHQFNFSTTLKVRITDLNYGGHVGNDVFLSLIHEARQRYLLHHGASELNFFGGGLIMADAAIEYKKELHYADELLISIAAAGFDRYGFDLFYKLELATGDAKALAGKAKTGMLCFDHMNKKLMPLPAQAATLLAVKSEQ